MKNTQERSVNRRKIPAAALAAACLCLVLAGTALAAQYFGVRIVDGAGGDDADVWMQGGIAYYPVDRLSDELKALENEDTCRSFGSWQEVEDFIGVDLMNNPVLDASPARSYSRTVTWGKHRVSGEFLVSTSVGLDDIRAQGCYEMGDVNIDVEGFLYTERKTEKAADWDERFYGIGFAEDTQTSRESYTAPNGLEAQVMAVERPSGHDTYIAAFSLNGVPFIVKAHSHNSLEEAQAALYQVLGGFDA